MAQITSFIRWAGGKSWLVPFVKELIENLDFNGYYEPFMGGASIFFSIDHPEKSVLSDINEDLVVTFTEIRDNPEKVIKVLQGYEADKDSYYRIRQMEPKKKHERAARFLYLNANSYNGLYRVNRSGKYNVPYGSRNVEINIERLRNTSKKLQGVEILCQDFDAIKEKISERDLVFLDPPYTVSKSKNGFIEYNAKLFALEDQKRLGELIDYMNQVGAYFILTNAAHDAILDIFKERGRLIMRERNSLIGGKASYRGKVKEYIFTNIPEKEVDNNEQ